MQIEEHCLLVAELHTVHLISPCGLERQLQEIRKCDDAELFHNSYIRNTSVSVVHVRTDQRKAFKQEDGRWVCLGQIEKGEYLFMQFYFLTDHWVVTWWVVRTSNLRITYFWSQQSSEGADCAGTTQSLQQPVQTVELAVDDLPAAAHKDMTFSISVCSSQ